MTKSLIFALDGRDDLANAIRLEANNLVSENQTQLGKVRIQKFSDGELCVDFTDSVRGKRVYLLTSPNTSDEIIKLMLAINAAKLDGADSIIPILPFYPYSRSDKKDYPRGPIGAKVIASMIEHAGATSIITFDLHADQTQGFLDIPVIHIEGKNVFDEYIISICNEKTIFCSPDAGSGKRVKRMRDQIHKKYNKYFNYVMLDKTRKEANVIDEMIIIGDVTGKDVIILDDMIDTGGTLCKAAEVLMAAGANSVRAVISHGVLSGHAFESIGESMLTELIISDSLTKADYMKICKKDFSEGKCISIHRGSDKIKVISIAKQIGWAMSAFNNNLSYEAIKANKQELV